MAIRRIVVDALQVGAEPTGVGSQARAIGEELRDLPPGLALELRCARDAAPLLAPSFPPGTRVVTPIPSARPRLRRIAVQQLGALRDGPDTLHVALGDQAPLLGRARLLAVVNDVRRLGEPAGTGWLERAWYRLLVPRVARRADVLVTISRFSRDELRRATGREAVVVAHHPPPRADRPADGGGPLLVVGAQRPYKGLDTVAGALSLLDEAERPRVVVAGPGPAGARDGLELLGWVDDERLERLYAEAEAVVAPSRYEGYDLPVAEALARGVPVVASAIPVHLEVGGGAILAFPPGDAGALAEALRALPSRRAELAAASLARSHALAAARPRWRELILAAAQ